MRKITHNLFSLIVFLSSSALTAQVGIGVATPNSSAQLDVTSTSKGFLPPRMSKVQRDAISSPTAGLIVWCINCGSNGELQVFNGTSWTNVTGGVASASTPTITTSTVNPTAPNTATAGGNVTDDGGSTITARGVCWSTTQNPTISNSKTTDAGTTGSFSSSITGLTGSTTYYLRAYATNSVGTSYGSQQIFTTSAFTCTSSVSVTYNGATSSYTVVANQVTGKCWLSSNLGSTRVATSYADQSGYGGLFQWGRGDDGHQVITSSTTATLSSSDNPGNPSFILSTSTPFDWRTPANNDLWQGVNGINNPCPSGFRVPTKAEWEAEIATWSGLTTTGAFNSTLKLTGAGYRKANDGSINSPGDYAYYASSTTFNNDVYLMRIVSNTASVVNSGLRAEGYSVRCIKD